MFLFKHWSGNPFETSNIFFLSDFSFIYHLHSMHTISLLTVQLTMIWAFILQSLMTVTSH